MAKETKFIITITEPETKYPCCGNKGLIQVPGKIEAGLLDSDCLTITVTAQYPEKREDISVIAGSLIKVIYGPW